MLQPESSACAEQRANLGGLLPVRGVKRTEWSTVGTARVVSEVLVMIAARYRDLIAKKHRTLFSSSFCFAMRRNDHNVNKIIKWLSPASRDVERTFLLGPSKTTRKSGGRQDSGFNGSVQFSAAFSLRDISLAHPGLAGFQPRLEPLLEGDFHVEEPQFISLRHTENIEMALCINTGIVSTPKIRDRDHLARPDS